MNLERTFLNLLSGLSYCIDNCYCFGGFQARRALRALRGLVRLKTLIQGQSVKRQAASTLRCMQTLARLQSQIRVRRIRMSEENQALQRQLQQKRKNEFEKLQSSVSTLFIFGLYTAGNGAMHVTKQTLVIFVQLVVILLIECVFYHMLQFSSCLFECLCILTTSSGAFSC